MGHWLTEITDDHYDKIGGPLPYGTEEISEAQYGSRLVPQSVFEGNTTTFVETIRSILDLGAAQVTFFALDVSKFGNEESNAVTPVWRGDNGTGPVILVSIRTDWSNDPSDWERMMANQELMTNVLVPAIEAITPGGGTYGNEGNPNQRDFQSAFYGSKYAKLLAIKDTYDPDGFFYVNKGVGSEAWNIEADGHMCRL